MGGESTGSVYLAQRSWEIWREADWDGALGLFTVFFRIPHPVF